MKRKDSLARSAMKLLCSLLGLVFLSLLAVTLVFQQYLKPIHFNTSKNPGQVLVQEVLSAFPLGNSDTRRIGGPDSELLNILLVGQDSRDDDAQGRSDAMILCTYHKRDGKLTMTSFLRDLYVPIPGHGSNRINAAYSFGGADLLKKTIDQNFNVAIDGCIEVDFSHFSEIIDQMGGVEITLRQDEADVVNQQTGSQLSEGSQKLDGSQALAYSRIRNLDRDGDFSRTTRQRNVLNALADSLRGKTLKELTPLLSTIFPMLTTDLSRGQILLYALEILPRLSDLDIISQRIPVDGTFTDQTIDGMAVLSADMAAQRKYLQDTLLK